VNDAEKGQDSRNFTGECCECFGKGERVSGKAVPFTVSGVGEPRYRLMVLLFNVFMNCLA
jgi:hypothetical protein